MQLSSQHRSRRLGEKIENSKTVKVPRDSSSTRDLKTESETSSSSEIQLAFASFGEASRSLIKNRRSPVQKRWTALKRLRRIVPGEAAKLADELEVDDPVFRMYHSEIDRNAFGQ